MKSFIIPGELVSLNEYVDAERSNKFAASKIKKEQTDLCKLASMSMPKVEDWECPVHIEIVWYMPTMRKDSDNISFAKKFIFDGMVCSKRIKNDSMKYINAHSDRFIHSPNDPKIHVIIHPNQKDNG